jgi:hypothetical protein
MYVKNVWIQDLDLHDEFIVQLHDRLLKLAQLPTHLLAFLGQPLPNADQISVGEKSQFKNLQVMVK